MSQKSKRELVEYIIKLYKEIRFPCFLPEIPHEWLEKGDEK